MTEITLREYGSQIGGMIEQGQQVEAIAHAKYILTGYPKYVTAYRLLGEAVLEAGQYSHAADLFRRVLGADTEDLVAWVGLSEACEKQGDLESAVWYMERAFELASDNTVVEEQLLHLRGRLDGDVPERVQLTRGALARLYLKGDLLSRAIAEFRALLGQQPERIDLRVALAEALWRNEQRLEASEACQRVLDELPYNLKANLLLGEIWASSERDEAQMHLRRAELLDPENRVARELFGPGSPLQARELRITPLEYSSVSDEERPDWMVEIEDTAASIVPAAEGEAALTDIGADLEPQIEIPAWLEQVMTEEEPAAAALPEYVEALQPEHGMLAGDEQIPDWLAGIEEKYIAGELEGTSIAEADPPLAETAPQHFSEEHALAAAGIAGVDASVAEAEALSDEGEVPAPSDEVLDWLDHLGDEEPGEAQTSHEAEARLAEILGQPSLEAPESAPTGLAKPSESLSEEVFDWPPYGEPSPEAETSHPDEDVSPVLEEVGLLEEASDDQEPPWFNESPEGEPDALQVTPEADKGTAAELDRPVATMAEQVETSSEEPVALVEGSSPEDQVDEETDPSDLPEWLAGDDVPSGDEALEWLEKLAEEKEARLPAGATVATTPDMGVDLGQVEAPVVEEEPQAEMEALEPAFGWTAFESDQVPALAAEAPVVEEEPQAEMEAPEPAFGWTAFESDQVPALASEAPLARELSPSESQTEAFAEVNEEEIAWEPVPDFPDQIDATAEMLGEGQMESFEHAVPSIEGEELARDSGPTGALATQDSLAAQQAYLQEHPRDFEAWLDIARTLWRTGEQSEALDAYSHAIRSSQLVPSVIADLEERVAQAADVGTQRALGDAYVRNGQLQEGLATYRQALGAL